MRFLTVSCSLLLAVVVSISAGSAKAEDAAEETIRWLSKEPVTLMDLGMIRLREDLRDAAADLIDLGYTVTPPRVGTYYEWRRGKIFAYVSIREPYARPSEQTCLDVFQRVLGSVKTNSEGGPQNIGWYLESLFMHEGPGNFGRPRMMGEGLLDAIRFQVTILPPDPMRDSRKVQCSGRMDAEADDIAVKIS